MITDHTGFYLIKTILLGPSNTGKTNIIKHLTNNTFTLIHDITIGIDIYLTTFTIQSKKIKLELWDTFGLSSAIDQAIEYSSKSNAVIFVLDISKKQTMEQLRTYILKYKEKNKSKFYGVIFGNKADKQNREITWVDGETFANEYGMNYVEISAKFPDGLSSISDAVKAFITQILISESVIIDDDENEDYYTNNNKIDKEMVHTTLEMFVKSMYTIFPLDDFILQWTNEMNEFYKSHIDGKKTVINFEELKHVILELNVLNKKLWNCLKLSGMSMYENSDDVDIADNPGNKGIIIATANSNTKVIKSKSFSIKNRITNITGAGSTNKGSKNKNSKIEDDVIDALSEFIHFTLEIRNHVKDAIYYYNTNFIRRFLSKSTNDKLNMIQWKENSNLLASIKLKKSELDIFFSKDIVSYKNSSDWHDYFQFNWQLEQIIESSELRILNDIKGNEIEFYRNKGDTIMCWLKQYRKAYNEQWEKVTMSNLKAMELEQWEEGIYYNGYKCYMNYKTAYEYADRSKERINEQIHWRADIALVYYTMGYYLKANFYILAANYIIYHNQKLVSQKVIDYVIKTGTKISSGCYGTQRKKGTGNAIENDGDGHNDNLWNIDVNWEKNRQINTAKLGETFPFDDKDNSYISISNINAELKRIQFCKSSLEELNEMNVLKEEMVPLDQKEWTNKLYKNIFLGLSYQDHEFTMQTEKYKKDISPQTTSWTTPQHNPSSKRDVNKYRYFLVIPRWISIGVMKIWDRFESKKQLKLHKQINDKLFNIYSSSLTFFKRKQYYAFLKCLSQEYDINKRLVSFTEINPNKNENEEINIEPRDIISIWIQSKFKPDDIALLLNLIGISLISLCSRSSITNNSTNETSQHYIEFKRYKKIALNVFEAGLQSELTKLAESIDKWMKKKIKMRENENPLRASLEEVRNSIRINIIMLYIIKDKDIAVTYIKEVEDTIKEMDFFPINEQLEVSKEWFSAWYGNNYDIKAKTLTAGDGGSNISFAKLEDNSIFNIISFKCNTILSDEFHIWNTVTNGKCYFTKKSFLDFFEEKFHKAKTEETDFFAAWLNKWNVFSIHQWKENFIKEPFIFQPPYFEFLSKYLNVKISLYSLFVSTEYVDTGLPMTYYAFRKSINLCSGNYISIHWALDTTHSNALYAFIPYSSINDNINSQISFAKANETLFPEVSNKIYFNVFKYYNHNPTERQIGDYFYLSMIKLSLYRELIKILDKDKIKIPLQLKYSALCEMRLCNYQHSINYMKMFLKKENKNDDLITFNTLEQVLKEKNIDQDCVQYYINWNKVKQSTSLKPMNSCYKILSIDGGGIRCLIQLIILCEIEYETQRNICDIFNMIIGTSTGAWIATWLCMKKDNGQPKYKVSDILKLILSNQECLFTESETSKKVINDIEYSYKYSSLKKNAFFKQVFNQTKITDINKNDLIIPWFNMSKEDTEIFTSYKIDNLLLIDILEAATAIPSLYEPVKLFDSTYYCDGCVNAFNPTWIAVIEAMKKGITRKDIKVLSLGSGQYPLKQDEIMWRNFDGTIGGVNNWNWGFLIDKYVNDHDLWTDKYNLEYNYHRWQVQLPTPIKLDSMQSWKELLGYSREYTLELKFSGKFNSIVNDIIY